MKLNFSDKNILIIGDSMLDVYHYANSTRISPEADVPSLTIDKTEYRLGGAANVAANVKTLGGNPFLVSVVGNDEYASILLDTLQEMNIDNFSILESNHKKTTAKIRYLNFDKHILRIDHEQLDYITVVEEFKFLTNIEDILSVTTIDCVVIQDYNKGIFSEYMIESIIGIAKKNKLPIIVDPKKNNIHCYNEIHIFKPNLKEFNQITGQDGFYELYPLAQDFMKNHEIDNMIVTLSDKGIFWCDGLNVGIEIPDKIDLVDVCGAGDSVTALLSLLQGTEFSLKEKSIMCNKIGGLSCTKLGTEPVFIDELNKIL